jgi:hypothetical protein
MKRTSVVHNLDKFRVEYSFQKFETPAFKPSVGRKILSFGSKIMKL